MPMILIFALILAACSMPQPPLEAKVEQSLPPAKPLPPKLSRLDSQKLAKQYFLEGLNYKYANKMDYAALFFEKAASFDLESEYLVNSLAELQRENGSSQSALTLLKAKNKPLDSLSEESLLLLAHLSLDLNQYDSADVYYDILTRKQPQEGKYWWEWAQSLEEAKNFHKLADVNRQLIPIIGYPEPFILRQLLIYSISKRQEEIPPFLEEVYRETGDVKWLKDALKRYEELNNSAKVKEIVENLMAQFPYDLDLLKKSLKMQAPKTAGLKLWQKWQEFQSAIPQEKELSQNQKDSLLIGMDHFLLDAARLSVYAKDYSQAKLITDTLIQLQPMNPSAWSLASGTEFMLGDTLKALQYSKTAYEKSNEEYRFASLYVKLLKTTHDYKTAEAWLNQIRKLNRDPLVLNLEVENFISYSYSLNQLRYNDPAEIENYQRLNLFALRGLDSLIAYLPQDDPHYPSLFLLEYRKAITLEKLDSINALQPLFEKLIKEYPQEASVLNYYGYTLIERDIDIAKGQVLVEKALSLEPETIAYLDSKAWGLYKQGSQLQDSSKIREALSILLEIQPRQIDDFYILEHIARCYQALGRREEFNATLTEIKKLAPHHPIFKEK